MRDDTIETMPGIKPQRIVTFDYRNWRGEQRQRKVLPNRIFFGRSEYHKGPPSWYLEAQDLERAPGTFRNFKLSDISNWQEGIE
jgi:predicted DNA-binding transcriptional regulator YafY